MWCWVCRLVLVFSIVVISLLVCRLFFINVCILFWFVSIVVCVVVVWLCVMLLMVMLVRF